MDNNTYNEILVTHQRRLFSAAFYMLRDADDAEDVIQEAFLRLWRFTGRIDPGKVTAWLNRVVHNLCIDQTRKRNVLRRHLGQPDVIALENLSEMDGNKSGPCSEGPTSPDQEELLEAMATLSKETRSIMIMHYFQGIKLVDIAEMLEMNPNSLKVRIHRARQALRLVLTRPEPVISARQETG
ncbi:MAG: RNA polymerase sigma factor [Gemmatimonadales bacterium]|nr:RNA polymerase sigma factor [Gemmatimonadales bacterium]